MFHDKVPYTDLHELNLDWILCEMKKLGIGFKELKENFDKFSTEIQDQLEVIQKWIDEFDPDYVEELINKYLANGVYFGLTSAGYFVAYIPKEWNNIIFNTTGYDIVVPIQPEFGHLVLSY